MIYSILYVSSAEEDWPKARNGLEGGLGDVRYTRAYCYYAGYVLDNTEPLGDGSGEFTSIGVLPLLGGVIRIE